MVTICGARKSFLGLNLRGPLLSETIDLQQEISPKAASFVRRSICLPDFGI
jgi:hypothetical protein